ncbi:MAG: YbjQ family protein [Nitrospiria bacterium]
MICPICGTQQRSADRCVQCRTPLSGERKKMDEEDSFAGIEQALEDSFNALHPPKQASKSSESKERGEKILIATTQRVEGKRIRKYFGLVHANAVLNLTGISPAVSGTEYQKLFKKAAMKALNNLRKEAAMAGANAVVATAIDYHQVDSESMLLSAIGTAVLLEAPK